MPAGKTVAADGVYRQTNPPVDLDGPVRAQKTVAEKEAHLRNLLVTRDDNGHDHVATGIVVHLGQRDLKR